LAEQVGNTLFSDKAAAVQKVMQDFRGDMKPAAAQLDSWLANAGKRYSGAMLDEVTKRLKAKAADLQQGDKFKQDEELRVALDTVQKAKTLSEARVGLAGLNYPENVKAAETAIHTKFQAVISANSAQVAFRIRQYMDTVPDHVFQPAEIHNLIPGYFDLDGEGMSKEDVTALEKYGAKTDKPVTAQQVVRSLNAIYGSAVGSQKIKMYGPALLDAVAAEVGSKPATPHEIDLAVKKMLAQVEEPGGLFKWFGGTRKVDYLQHLQNMQPQAK
jgi:hypothetical protein